MNNLFISQNTIMGQNLENVTINLLYSYGLQDHITKVVAKADKIIDTTLTIYIKMSTATGTFEQESITIPSGTIQSFWQSFSSTYTKVDFSNNPFNPTQSSTQKYITGNISVDR